MLYYWVLLPLLRAMKDHFDIDPSGVDGHGGLNSRVG